MKFPDLVHAAKPEPHHQMPQAATAHDTFWDFVSLMPESTHMLLWVMSDRAIPRSYRMMQGFGVHTFRFVNAQGESKFVKFHWNPVRGTHSLDWDECVKINGADPDYHRRDLWERIESGAYPEWELGLQVFTEEQAEQFSFDILDATKIVPEELVPVRIVGRMVLNRNPDNFFAQIEQAAFSPGNTVPGIGLSPDKMLLGRAFAYNDAQRNRIGTNFHQLPVNQPKVPVNTYMFDGQMAYHNSGSAPVYAPNSGGRPWSDETGPMADGWEADGEMVRSAYTLHPDDDDFSQPGILVREVFDDAQRNKLVEQVAGSLLGGVREPVLSRAFDYWHAIDGDVGGRIEDKVRTGAAKKPAEGMGEG
jgi:catalase